MRLDSRDALRLWRGALAESLRRGAPDLSWRQLAVLLEVYLAPPPHTVRALARELGLRKPAVTRALDRLSRLDFVRRKDDPADGRSVLVQRTVKGSVFLSELGDLVARAAHALGEAGRS